MRSFLFLGAASAALFPACALAQTAAPATQTADTGRDIIVTASPIQHDRDDTPATTPGSALPQSMANGAASAMSPNGTIGVANWARTWRTALTVPLGENRATPLSAQAGNAVPSANSSARAPSGVSGKVGIGWGTGDSFRKSGEAGGGAEKLPKGKNNEQRCAAGMQQQCDINVILIIKLISVANIQWQAGNKTYDCLCRGQGRFVFYANFLQCSGLVSFNIVVFVVNPQHP